MTRLHQLLIALCAVMFGALLQHRAERDVQRINATKELTRHLKLDSMKTHLQLKKGSLEPLMPGRTKD